MVTIMPIRISALMTSPALTDIRCASSPTEIVSGTAYFLITGAVGR